MSPANKWFLNGLLETLFLCRAAPLWYVCRMKSYIASGALLLLLCGCSHFDSAQRGVATIEFDRQEDNDPVNNMACTLVLSDNQRIILVGGERAVASVLPGSFYVTAFSVAPNNPDSYEKAWRSPRVTFKVVSGERLHVIVAPAASGSTCTGGWTIHATDKTLQATATPAAALTGP
jgi:hypothetical protein